MTTSYLDELNKFLKVLCPAYHRKLAIIARTLYDIQCKREQAAKENAHEHE